MNTHRKENTAGFTLLITLLLMGVLLGVSGSLLNVVLRQFQISNISETSEVAFQAANAGIECALFHDFDTYPTSIFDVDGEAPIVARDIVMGLDCMGDSSDDVAGVGNVTSGQEQKFQYSWGSPEVCTEFSVYKFYSTSGNLDMSAILGKPANTKLCDEDVVCTIIKSRGYNTACANIATTPRTVERELIQVY